MEHPKKSAHDIVEHIIADSYELEDYSDVKPSFEVFAEVFDEFMNNYIHNRLLAGRKFSEPQKKRILYDRASLIFIWDRHVQTWTDVEAFMADWIRYYQ